MERIGKIGSHRLRAVLSSHWDGVDRSPFEAQGTTHMTAELILRDGNFTTLNPRNPAADAVAIARSASEAGMTTMFQDGAAKCRAGITSAAEVFRVTTAS